jgi:hypothetical protein
MFLILTSFIFPASLSHSLSASGCISIVTWMDLIRSLQSSVPVNQQCRFSFKWRWEKNSFLNTIVLKSWEFLSRSNSSHILSKRNMKILVYLNFSDWNTINLDIAPPTRSAHESLWKEIPNCFSNENPRYSTIPASRHPPKSLVIQVCISALNNFRQSDIVRCLRNADTVGLGFGLAKHHGSATTICEKYLFLRTTEIGLHLFHGQVYLGLVSLTRYTLKHWPHNTGYLFHLRGALSQPRKL